MTSTIPTDAGHDWHSHVYFDADSVARAENLIAAMKQKFGPDVAPDAAIEYGRWHHRPVGPHPDFSIQLAYPDAMFAAVMGYLSLNRNGLVIFTHPVTGEDLHSQLCDHRDHAIWMGAVRPLKLAQFGGVDQ